MLLSSIPAESPLAAPTVEGGLWSSLNHARTTLGTLVPIDAPVESRTSAPLVLNFASATR